MHDPALVRVLHRFGNLLRDAQRFVDGNRTVPDAICKRGPFDQLHHERMSSPGIFESVDRGDVGMIERREHLRLALESRHAFGVARECFGQDFQRHIAPELGIARAVDLAHPAGANRGKNLVWPEAIAGGERHLGLDYTPGSISASRSNPDIACPNAAKMFSSDVMHWDFALILIFFGTAVPLLGRRRIRQLMRMPETTKRDRLRLYASTITFQWFAAAIVLWRANAHEILFSSLGLAIPRPALTAIVSIVLAAFVLANQLLSLRRLAAHPAEAQGVLPQLALKIFPQDAVERVAFFGVVVTVAICEELIYRGFVQRIFEDWSGGLILAGIFGSAAMFAAAHLYQGKRGVITTLVVGILFAAIRAWTGSLLAPFIAHFIADITAGLLAPSRLRSAISSVESASTTTALISM
jgi:uncharacterized protein